MPWPRSLYARIALILCSGLVAAHLLTFGWVQHERADLARSMMLSYLGRDVAASVAVLDRLPAAERQAWLPRLERPSYRYELAPASGSEAARGLRADLVRQSLGAELGLRRIRTLRTGGGSEANTDLQVELALSDGRPLTLHLGTRPSGISATTAGVLALQLLVLASLTWWAARVATRPLARLAEAADAYSRDLQVPPLPEHGPDEVARAGQAFRAMHERIQAHLRQRMQILAAVSHDLRTPLARIALRADLVGDEALRAKLRADVAEMQSLVEEGLAYARAALPPDEPTRVVDIGALLESLAGDYQDAGAAVRLAGTTAGAATGGPIVVRTRPQALRRVLANLIDNALKFGGAAELVLQRSPGRVVLAVLDRGPGIADEQMESVWEPFRRLEPSRNRATGGAGLGLAIARQLALALPANIALRNRAGGGLEARVSLPLLPNSPDGSVPDEGKEVIAAT